MIRRRQSPPPRRGPSLLGTVARTAAISGTATATSRAVHNKMDQRAMQSQQAQAAAESRPETEPINTQDAAQPIPAAAPQADLLAQLTQLAQMKETGILSEAEFQLAKAKLLS